MSPDPAQESWEAWTTRIGAELAALTEEDWLTFTVLVRSSASREQAAGGRSGRSGGSGGTKAWRQGVERPDRRPPVPDVFLQARRVGGVLALECIGDTEFEGITDLEPEQQDALTQLGWVRDGDDPQFSAAFERADDRDGEAAMTAARLLRASLVEVLGAGLTVGGRPETGRSPEPVAPHGSSAHSYGPDGAPAVRRAARFMTAV